MQIHPLQQALYGTVPAAGRFCLYGLALFFSVVAQAEVGQLEEVIVTAQKRQEPLQKTPLAITAITGRELEAMRVDNTMDLAHQLPSLVMFPFTGNRAAPNMSIRGMGNLDSQTTKDGANGIYIDGVPVGRTVGLAADVADLERVELLRGPQGTLYGRNTTGGAINFITVRPEKTFSFEQSLTAGSYGLLSGRTRVNVPLGDQVQTRMAYLHSSNRGWVDNTNRSLPNQTRFNQDEKDTMRWAWRFLATDRLTMDVDLDHSRTTYGNVFFQRVVGPAAVSGLQQSSPTLKGLSPSLLKTEGQSLTLNWKLEPFQLSSITAWRRMDNRAMQNYADAFIQTDDQTQKQVSQEFQLIGDALDRRLEYVAGLFWFDEKGDETVASELGPVTRDVWRVTAASKSKAVYGQVGWKPAVLEDRLRLTLGLRQTYDERAASKTFINSSFDAASNGMVVPASRRFRKFTPTYTVDYALTSELNLYGRLAYGYRAGGFNTRSPRSGFGQGFGQEDVRSTEVGLKSDLFERKARLNIALFNNQFSNLQVDQVRSPSIFTDTLNAGRARIRGAEFELTTRLGHGLTARWFHTWLDARYGSYVDNGVDLAAVKHVPLAPRGQGGLGLHYEGERGEWGKWNANLDYQWQTRYYTNPNPETLTAGFGIWNARIELTGIRLPQGQLRLALWGRNLADKTYRLANTNLGGMTAQFGAPRTLGVDVIYSF